MLRNSLSCNLMQLRTVAFHDNVHKEVHLGEQEVIRIEAAALLGKLSFLGSVQVCRRVVVGDGYCAFIHFLRDPVIGKQ